MANSKASAETVRGQSYKHLFARRRKLPEAILPPVRWTPEREEQLRTLWAGTLPTGKIAKALGCSPGAALTKAHKLGLPPHMRPKSVFVRGAARHVKKPTPPDVDLKQVPDLVSLELSLANIETHQCRWVTSGCGVGALFCGHPSDDPYGYCKPHHRLAYVPAAPRKVQSTDFALYRRAA